MSDYDYLVKMVMVGDSGVGKSCLVEKYNSGTFRDSFITTIGVDFKIIFMQYNNLVFKVQIWDTAGQERFRAIARSYFRGAQGMLLVYDVTDRESFESLDRWLKDSAIEGRLGMQSILLANKKDCSDRRCVSTEEGEAYAQEHNLAYLETSAKTGEGVDQAFRQLLHMIYHEHIEIPHVKETEGRKVVTLAAREVNSGCC